MKDKLKKFDAIIDELDTFKYIISGELNHLEDQAAKTVNEHIDLYQSSVDELNQLFDDIKREYGDIKIKDLKIEEN